jgi:tRNA A37 threonylcarbamoyltransferase TsaD
MPIPKLFDMTLSMSYAGIETWFRNQFKDKSKATEFTTLYELGFKDLTFKEVCDLCSALQFTGFNHI